MSLLLSIQAKLDKPSDIYTEQETHKEIERHSDIAVIGMTTRNS